MPTWVIIALVQDDMPERRACWGNVPQEKDYPNTALDQTLGDIQEPVWERNFLIKPEQSTEMHKCSSHQYSTVSGNIRRVISIGPATPCPCVSWSEEVSCMHFAGMVGDASCPTPLLLSCKHCIVLNCYLFLLFRRAFVLARYDPLQDFNIV